MSAPSQLLSLGSHSATGWYPPAAVIDGALYAACNAFLSRRWLPQALQTPVLHAGGRAPCRCGGPRVRRTGAPRLSPSGRRNDDLAVPFRIRNTGRYSDHSLPLACRLAHLGRLRECPANSQVRRQFCEMVHSLRRKRKVCVTAMRIVNVLAGCMRCIAPSPAVKGRWPQAGARTSLPACSPKGTIGRSLFSTTYGVHPCSLTNSHAERCLP